MLGFSHSLFAKSLQCAPSSKAVQPNRCSSDDEQTDARRMNPKQRRGHAMGLLRRSEAEARKLSSELRNDDSGNLRRRRTVIGLSMLGTASLGLIGLYQTGVIKGLPEPNLPYLDAEKVDASAEAYEYLSTPDAILG